MLLKLCKGPPEPPELEATSACLRDCCFVLKGRLKEEKRGERRER